LAEFKKASNELKQTWEDEVRLDKEKEEMSQILKETSVQASEILNVDNSSAETPAEKAETSPEKKDS